MLDYVLEITSFISHIDVVEIETPGNSVLNVLLLFPCVGFHNENSLYLAVPHIHKQD